MEDMEVSPADLRQRRFRTTFRGFDRGEVTTFLMAASSDYEQVLREADRLRQEVAHMAAQLREYREREKGLMLSLGAAQQLADDIKANAEEQARLIVRDAQGRSDLLVQKAQAHFEHIHREIDELKLKRKDVETSIEAMIQTLRNAQGFGREREEREREDEIPRQGLSHADVALQNDGPTAPDQAATPLDGAPIDRRPSEVAPRVNPEFAAISTIAQSLAAEIRAKRDEETRPRAATVPEPGVPETTVDVTALPKPGPSWLRPGASVPDIWTTQIAGKGS